MWDLPGPGLEPMSPALAGGFLTTVPPGKSEKPLLHLQCQLHRSGSPGTIDALDGILIVPKVLCSFESLNVKRRPWVPEA